MVVLRAIRDANPAADAALFARWVFFRRPFDCLDLGAVDDRRLESTAGVLIDPYSGSPCYPLVVSRMRAQSMPSPLEKSFFASLSRRERTTGMSSS